MSYTVITVTDEFAINAAEKRTREVNNYIALGWKPLGGVSVSRSDWSTDCKIVLAQAMIKE